MNIRMLIVDDDEIIRKGMVNHPKWKELGIDVVAEAENGKEALRKIEEHMPQVVLTDIKMPIMDGLQLSKLIHVLYPKIKCILLTAYEELEYLRKAIEYRVDSYVLKSDEEEKLFESVQKATQELHVEKEEERIREEIRQFKRRQFFREISCGKYSDEEIRDFALSCHVSLRYERCCMVSFYIESLKKFNEIQFMIRSKEWYQQIEGCIGKHCREAGLEFFFFQGNENLNLAILDPISDRRMDVEGILNQAVLEFKSETNILLYAGMGRWYDKISNLYESYEEALKINYLRDSLNDQYPKERYPVLCFGREMSIEETPEELVRKVKEYIELNYRREDLALQEIADHIHLSPNYVSTLFKKQSGMNISEYLTVVRLNQASKLLTTTSLKTYEISEMVGYPNSQYFSVLFKKHYKMTPKEYRSMDKSETP